MQWAVSNYPHNSLSEKSSEMHEAFFPELVLRSQRTGMRGSRRRVRAIALDGVIAVLLLRLSLDLYWASFRPLAEGG
jgi:hypothetical protein